MQAFYEEKVAQLKAEVEKVKQEKYEREKYLVKIINSNKSNPIPVATLDLNACKARNEEHMREAQ